MDLLTRTKQRAATGANRRTHKPGAAAAKAIKPGINQDPQQMDLLTRTKQRAATGANRRTHKPGAAAAKAIKPGINQDPQRLEALEILRRRNSTLNVENSLCMYKSRDNFPTIFPAFQIIK